MTAQHLGASARRCVAVCTVVTAALTVVAATQDPCPTCLRAEYWEVPPDAWKGAKETFPETQALLERRPNAEDVGVAFSGGGTRSATATMGQLRGLRQNGWLDKVRYVTAVSGGAWAAIPFTYSLENLDTLLGVYTPPGGLDYDTVVGRPNGLLADAITKSSIAGPSMREAFAQIGTVALSKQINSYKDDLFKLLGHGRREPDRVSKTFARILGETFIEAIRDLKLRSASQLRFAWDVRTVNRMVERNPVQLNPVQFVTSDPALRPFLIVGGSMVLDQGGRYPRLAPVEYTPLYTGVRQQFGLGFGGTYVWSWAYDSQQVGIGEDDRKGGRTIRIKPDPDGSTFTVADVAASTGAAPQLFLLLGDGLPEAARRAAKTAAQYFPSFTPFVVRHDRPITVTAPVPHGDGGFTDNLGLMPLLARQVKNVIVFVNSSSHFEQNDDLRSYFSAVPTPGGSGDKSMNVVFDPDRYAKLRDRYDQLVTDGKPLIYCAEGWSVGSNQTYNVRSYDGLNICWVYTFVVPHWEKDLSPRLQELLTGPDTKNKKNPRNAAAKNFENFPLFKTFEQNSPHLIQLTTPQVNMLAHLTSWTIADSESKETILEKLKVLRPKS